MEKSCARTMRCLRVKNGKQCTSTCKCVNCGNGKVFVEVKKRRNREQHIISPSHDTSLKYLLSTGEDLNLPKLTRTHHFILEALVFTTMKAGSCRLLQLEENYLQNSIFEKFKTLLWKDEHLELETIKKWLNERKVKESLFLQTVIN